MHPRLEELFAYVASNREALLATVGSVAPDEMHRRLGDGVWSVAENLEHLAYVERALALRIRQWFDDARAQGLGPDTSTESVIHSLDRYGVATRHGRVTAGERVRPRGELEPDEALAALAGSRETLLAIYREGDGLDLSKPKAPHYVLGELDLYQWLLFVGQHEARHTLQIVETLDALRGGTPTAAPD